MSAVLSLQRVRAGYGGIDVVHGVDLTVGAGEVVALLGPNGAGKTTTLQVISGQITPSSGTVSLMGHVVNGVRPDKLARAGVCLVPEGHGVFPNLTVRENLMMIADSGASVATIEEKVYDLFPRLAERRKQTAGTLSGGEQQMLALSRALTTDPAVLLLDELSMGLAPMIVEELYLRVAEMAARGMSILIVEQFAEVALGVANRAAVMVNGEIRAIGEPSEVAQHLPDAYLGG